MAGSSSSNPSPLPDRPVPAVRLLYAGMLLFTLIGGGIAAWIVNQWIEHPEIRAAQFNFEAPLWPAALVFVVGATAAGIGLLWSAARRVQDGEDLFTQRHRRRPSASETSSKPD